MEARDNFRYLLSTMYPSERVEGILEQIDQCEESAGYETLAACLADAGQPPAYHLVIRESGKPMRIETLGTGEHFVGRVVRSSIVVHNRCVSRIHCLVTVHSNGYVSLRDLHSQNGTSVNGFPLAKGGRCILDISDEVTIAGTTLRLVKM